MRIAVFSSQPHDRASLALANESVGHELVFIEPRLTAETAARAEDCPVVSLFANDIADRPVLEQLARGGTRYVALRSAGYTQVDLQAADALDIVVTRVPDYSPHAVSEYTIGLLLALERRIHLGWTRTRNHDVSLDGLVGRILHGRTVGVVGTGRIGSLVARALLQGLGARVIATDPVRSAELQDIGVVYVDPPTLFSSAEIVTFHCPLTPGTWHLLNAEAIARARTGLVVVNTSRGAVVDTRALVAGLESGKIGGVALDVYEQEGDLFYPDLSNRVVPDDLLHKLASFANVITTAHQAFLTREALDYVARATIANVSAFVAGRPLRQLVTYAEVQGSNP